MPAKKMWQEICFKCILSGGRMKIGIISDSHDRIENLNKALDRLKNSAKVLIHCGDFCAPFMMPELARFNRDVHCVFGNTDDRFTSVKKANESGIHLHGNTAKLELGGKKILVNHYPEIAQAFVLTGEYDAVFYGHNHTAKKEKINNPFLVNPGDIMGLNNKPSFAIYDTELNDVEIIGLE